MENSDIENDENRLQESRQYWDHAAPNFDHEPDHGLRDPIVFEAWVALLKTWLPSAPSAVLDIGCGTGSLSVALAGLDHKVTGVDLSPAMLSVARAKTTAIGLDIDFLIMDAVFPSLAARQFDAIICRHLLWALPEPQFVLQSWASLLKKSGRLILVEGFWEAGGGLHFEDILEMLPPLFTSVTVENLSDRSTLWGRKVTDERYAVIAG